LKRSKDVLETDWSKLSDGVKTILERIDINRKSADIEIGSTINIPYFNGVFTESMAEEIIAYQHSPENKGYYSACKAGNILKVNFLKRAF